MWSLTRIRNIFEYHGSWIHRTTDAVTNGLRGCGPNRICLSRTPDAPFLVSWVEENDVGTWNASWIAMASTTSHRSDWRRAVWLNWFIQSRAIAVRCSRWRVAIGDVLSSCLPGSRTRLSMLHNAITMPQCRTIVFFCTRF